MRIVERSLRKAFQIDYHWKYFVRNNKLFDAMTDSEKEAHAYWYGWDGDVHINDWLDGTMGLGEYPPKMQTSIVKAATDLSNVIARMPYLPAGSYIRGSRTPPNMEVGHTQVSKRFVSVTQDFDRHDYSVPDRFADPSFGTSSNATSNYFVIKIQKNSIRAMPGAFHEIEYILPPGLSYRLDRVEHGTRFDKPAVFYFFSVEALDLRSVIKFYENTGYYSGPVSQEIKQSYNTLVTKETDGRKIKLSTDAKQLRIFDRGNTSVVARGDGEIAYKIAKSPESAPILLMESRINTDLKANYHRYQILTDSILEVGENGVYLKKKFLDPAQMATSIKEPSPEQLADLRKKFEGAKQYALDKGIGLDLKASNLWWNGTEWVLFDCAPRMGHLPYGFTADVADFATYLEHWRNVDPAALPGNQNRTLEIGLKSLAK